MTAVGVASFDEIKDRMLRIASGAHKPAADEPKRWYVPQAAASRIMELEAALGEALEGWEDGANYKGEYLKEKHGDAADIARVRAVLQKPVKERRLTRQEKIAAALLAADDEVSVEHGEKMIGLGRTAEHSGDCTKQPWSCIRCRYDDCMRFAAELEVNLGTFGLSIAG